mgnify:CR=1 FL=1
MKTVFRHCILNRDGAEIDVHFGCVYDPTKPHLYTCVLYTHYLKRLWGLGDLHDQSPNKVRLHRICRVRDGSRLRPVPLRYWFTTARPPFGVTPCQYYILCVTLGNYTNDATSHLDRCGYFGVQMGGERERGAYRGTS